MLAKVVDQAGSMQLVQDGVAAQPYWVVVVAVDAEDGHPDVEVGISVIHVLAAGAVAEIDLRVAHQTERYGSVTIHMVSQDLKITSTLHKNVTSNTINFV